MLRGNSPAKIDDRGRLKIPNGFRAFIEHEHGRELFVTGAWWLVTIPGIAIALLVLGVNLLGDGLRDRVRRAKAVTG